MNMMDILFAQQINGGGSPENPNLHEYDFTQSLKDIGSLRTDAQLTGGAKQDSSGVHLTAANNRVKLFSESLYNKTLEVKFGTISWTGSTLYDIAAITCNSSNGTIFPLFWNKRGQWEAYGLTEDGTIDHQRESGISLNFSTLSNSLLKIEFNADGCPTYYLNDTVKATIKSVRFKSDEYVDLIIGGAYSPENYNQFITVTIESVKIYNN